MPAYSMFERLRMKFVVANVTSWYNVDKRDSPHGRSEVDHSFTCKQHHACLYLLSVHQMALSLIVVTDI